MTTTNLEHIQTTTQSGMTIEEVSEQMREAELKGQTMDGPSARYCKIDCEVLPSMCDLQ